MIRFITVVGSMDNSKKQALRECHQELRTGILLRNFLPELRPVLLTDVEYSRIEDQKGNVDMVDMLIRILLTKDNQHFDAFCTVLQNNGHVSLANRLLSTSQGASKRTFMSGNRKLTSGTRKNRLHRRRSTPCSSSEGMKSVTGTQKYACFIQSTAIVYMKKSGQL